MQEYPSEHDLYEKYELFNSNLSYANSYLNIKGTKTTHLKLLVDRGIFDFRLFSNILKEEFPNLSNLCIEQNYSIENVDNFYTFLKTLSIPYIQFEDMQSKFIFDINLLFESLAENSELILCINMLDDQTDLEYKKYTFGDKTIKI